MAQLAPPGIDPGALAAALGQLLPVIPLPIASPAADVQLAGFEGTLQGYSLRETSGGAQTQENATTSTATGALIAAVLPDTAGQQTFITGFDVTLGTPAAAATVAVAVTGITTPITYQVNDLAVGGAVLSIRFPQPIPGTAITVTVPAVGGGAAANSVTAYGYSSTGSAAIVELYSGTTVGGTLLVSVEVQPGTTNTQSLLAGILPFAGGLFLHVVSGKVKGTVWVRRTLPS